MEGSILVAALVMAASPGVGPTFQTRPLSVPTLGVETTVAPGEEFYSFSSISTKNEDGAQLEEGVKAGFWLSPSWYDIGAQLRRVETKAAFKACASDGNCFVDDNGDGYFDRHTIPQAPNAKAQKLKKPVKYSRIVFTSVTEGSFKAIILFTGGSSDSLRFSYREFNDDMARPAFTEELSVPREPFPQMIRLKDRQFEVIRFTGLGLTYRLVK